MELNFVMPILESWSTLGNPALANMTFDWYPSDAEKAYQQTANQKYGRDAIKYHFNEHGFRCDQFSKAGPSILFVGCSHTVGVGLPLEDTWSWQFKTAIEQELNRPITYWNLAHGGMTQDYAVRQLILSKDFLEPDVIIALLPTGCRQEVGNENHVNVISPTTRNASKHYAFICEENAMFTTAKTLFSLREITRGWSGGFFWKSYDMISDYFGPMTAHRFDHNRLYAEWKDADLARDLLHAGPVSNAFFTKNLVEEVGDRVLEILRHRN
jgi:hypothetical protein